MVFQQMRELIATGEWAAGEKIPSETTLADNMGVSRISVRAALQKLASMGVIERKQGKGTVVCELNGIQDMNRLIPMLILNAPNLETMNEFRMILECGAVELAATRATRQDIEEMEANLYEMYELIDAGADCAELDVEFHMILAKASGNSLISQTESIMRDSFLDCMKTYKSIMGADVGCYFHEKLISAIRERNPVRAKQIMAEHLSENARATERTKQRDYAR